MLIVPTYVAKSKISGYGLFAGVPIKKGTRTWALDPNIDVRIPFDVYDTLDEHVRKAIAHYLYADFETYENSYIFGMDNDKFTNHSDNPNVNLEALRDIEAGEELFSDYREYDVREGQVMHDFLK